MALPYGQSPNFFPLKKSNIIYWHCGFHNHTGEECHKCIIEEYLTKQAKWQQQLNDRLQIAKVIAVIKQLLREIR